MYINNNNPWTAPVRTLTNLSCLTGTQLQNQTLAAASQINFFASSGVYGIMSLSVQAGAANSAGINYWDGTNGYSIQVVGAGTTGGFGGCLISTGVGIRLVNNDGVNIVKWWRASMEVII